MTIIVKIHLLSLLRNLILFMSFGYIDKSAYDTDDSHRLVINQTCFSDAIVFSY